MLSHKDLEQTEQDTQFVISHELLYLFRWLIEHEPHLLKKLISKAVTNGLQHELNKLETHRDLLNLEDMQHHLVDFFTVSETLLAHAMQQAVTRHAEQNDLMPAVDHLDANVCDDELVRKSLAKATKAMHKNPDVDAKQTLYKELLKRWKPINKKAVN